MTLSDIIMKLEGAGEGDSELDGLIAENLGWRQSMNDGEWFAPSDNPNPEPLPAYTTSIDAALMLVPEGCAFSVGCEIDLTPTAMVFGHEIHADEYAATPALALCLAALKARKGNAHG